MQTSTGNKIKLVVKKRNGQHVPFFGVRIQSAIESACKAHIGVPQESQLDKEWQEKVEKVTAGVANWCELNASEQGVIFIEDIQNAVVAQLINTGLKEIAVEYEDYRKKQELRRFESERLTIRKRDGRVVSFKPEKIAIAIGKAFEAHQGAALTDEQQFIIIALAERVVLQLKAGEPYVRTVDIESIQDIVENVLMDSGYHDIAKSYIIYRQLQHKLRKEQVEAPQPPLTGKESISIINDNGQKERLDIEKLKLSIAEVCHGLEDSASVELVLQRTLTNCYEGIPAERIKDAMLLAVRPLIEEEPAYSFVAARILLRSIYKEVVGNSCTIKEMRAEYASLLKKTVEYGVSKELMHPNLLNYDLEELGRAIKPEQDLLFRYMGLQTLYDRYFIHYQQRRIETPQLFFMRIAMGLAQNEGEQKTARAIQFYNVLSSFRFMSSTPTLFNSGTLHPQLSSCFLTTIGDDLDEIFKCIKDNALLSKWSGGLGNDWTPVRALGSHIKGTNGNSQGVIPFMKVANDTAVAVNQGGKRQGAVCGYLEVWHLDIEEFLELRKNTGDDRRRTHDMHTANWIPDLFMKRVAENKEWSLFSPNEASDLHDLYGTAFEKRYLEYEALAKENKLRQYKSIPAVQLWRKMLSMLFETGHPWITFKDPSNLRSPQDHKGVVHSSNLCTEILLNTSGQETAVCNLGSVNLAVHTTPAGINEELLADTVRTAIRMLDNVIDLNFYPTQEAAAANKVHRPIGLGLMGFQDALYIQGVSYSANEAIEFADSSMELISYYAILASSELAKEKGAYGSYQGSKWDRGLLPIDTIELLNTERGGYLTMDRASRLDWTPVRESIKQNGMRNSNTMAIAPTATIANITGVTQSIEPTYKNLFVKSNLSGEFTVANPYLVEELKALGIWDKQMRSDLKYFDGSLREVERIPQSIKDRYLTAFEIDYEWIIECASRRQKWIDMGQSLNLYMAEPSGKKMHMMYSMAWEKGLKTTYYLRSLGATRVEASTLDVNRYKNVLGQRDDEKTQDPPESCTLNADGECEACQ